MTSTTHDIVRILNQPAQSQPTIKGINGETLTYDPATGGFVDQSNGVSYSRQDGGWAATPTQPASNVGTPEAAGPSSYLTPNAAGALNIPYGADYLNPVLNAYLTLAGLNQQQQQFQQNAAYNAAAALASLRAQGPLSAAELAFRQAGMGYPAIGGSTAAIEGLLGASTRGATGNTVTDFGNGQSVSTPNTLSGQQLQGLEANPNLAGVVQSFATAGGNPDIYKRSIQALLPASYQASGSGMF